MGLLEDTVASIPPLEYNAMETAVARQNRLAIPAGSLGRLHEFAIRLAGITGEARPQIRNPALVVMAGDHGVAVRGVSRFPQEVTREMVANFLRGGAAINALAAHFGIRLTVIDMGVAGLPPAPHPTAHQTRLRHLRVAEGTRDLSSEPAMTSQQAIECIENGIRAFTLEREAGLDAVGTGDMGIGNTTPSAAIAAVMLEKPPEAVVNRGTGIDDASLLRKIRLVEKALSLHRPDSSDPLDVLAKVGGFEIGGIAGLILAACAARTPVVIDGYISTAAAMLATRFHSRVGGYLFSGHRSAVAGHHLMLEALGLMPMVDFGLRLGEGTGAAYGLAILSSAARLNHDMLTFDEATVSNPGDGR